MGQNLAGRRQTRPDQVESLFFRRGGRQGRAESSFCYFYTSLPWNLLCVALCFQRLGTTHRKNAGKRKDKTCVDLFPEPSTFDPDPICFSYAWMWLGVPYDCHNVFGGGKKMKQMKSCH